jgi:hypothetical protein
MVPPTLVTPLARLTPHLGRADQPAVRCLRTERVAYHASQLVARTMEPGFQGTERQAQPQCRLTLGPFLQVAELHGGPRGRRQGAEHLA